MPGCLVFPSFRFFALTTMESANGSGGKRAKLRNNIKSERIETTLGSREKKTGFQKLKHQTMKKRLAWTWLLLTGLSVGPVAKAQDTPTVEDLGEPVISFVSSSVRGVYFSMANLEGSGTDTVYLQLRDGDLNPYVLTDSVLTRLSCIDSVQGVDSLKIYAKHPEKTGRFYAQGTSMKSIDLSRAENLIWLDLRDNPALTQLDLSHNPELIILRLNGTALESLDVSGLDSLQYLDVSMTEVTELDVSGNHNLLYFNASYTDLKEVDLTHNTNLYEIFLDYTGISELNTSIFPHLQQLGVNGTAVSEFDFSQNPNLFALYASSLTGNSVPYIDVTMCPVLAIFHASNVGLERVDFSKNPDLYSLYVYNNRLYDAGVDPVSHPKLGELMVWNNYLTLETLPRFQLVYYNFNGQYPMQIKEHYEVGEEIDLSSQLMVEDYRTSYAWYTGESYPYTPLQEGVDYTISNGKTVFLRAQPMEVFCGMTNEYFPELELTTTPITIGGAANESWLESNCRVYSQDRAIVVEGASGQVQVFDLTGRRLAESHVDGGQYRFETPVSGLYIVRVQDGTDVLNRKVVVR